MAIGSKYELSDVIKAFGKQLIQQENLSPQQVKVLHNIISCRTAVLGGHKEECDHCSKIRYSYNSCGDRHCPKCQITKQAIWVEDLIEATLPVNHYHIIFTVPHELNDICLWNDRLYYKILFSAVKRTLHSFGYSHFGVETGAIAILHSWGQNLSLHPHIHCLVPAAGYSLNGEWKHIGDSKRFLYSVYQLSDTFKGKFLDSLTRELNKLNMHEAFLEQRKKARSKNWVVFSEASMAKATHVMQYLGQYTHRVAITNQRILDITDTHVVFLAKDYRDQDATSKPTRLEGVEFLKRFCLHVMPERFVRIRRFGIYNHTTIRNLELQFLPEPELSARKIKKKLETKQERIKRLTGIDICKCSSCNKGKMVVTKKLPRIRAPSGHLPSILFLKLL